MFTRYHALLADRAAAASEALGDAPEQYRLISITPEWKAWARIRGEIIKALVDDFASAIVRYYEDDPERRHGWLWAMLDRCPHIADEDAADAAAAFHDEHGGDLWYLLQAARDFGSKRRAAVIVAQAMHEAGERHPLVVAVANLKP